MKHVHRKIEIYQEHKICLPSVHTCQQCTPEINGTSEKVKEDGRRATLQVQTAELRHFTILNTPVFPNLKVTKYESVYSHNLFQT
jgi:hypothetical protein